MALRVADFARGYVTGVTRVEAVGPGDVDLRALLQVPEGVEYADLGPGGTVAASAETLGVLTLEKDIDTDALAAALGEVRHGGAVLLLLGWPALDLPWHRVLDAAVSADLQVVDAVTVAARRYPTAAVLRRAERLVVPPPYLGAGHHPPAAAADDDAAERRLTLRMAGELAFVGLRERRLRVVAEETREELRQRTQELRQRDQELAAATRALDRARAELRRRPVAALVRRLRARRPRARGPAQSA